LLRALAITFVVVTHYNSPLLPGGSVGVAIFFCLSGFLITRNLLDNQVSTYDFFVRRIFRIYPTYIVACSLNLLMLYLAGSQKDFALLARSIPDLLLVIKIPHRWINFGVGVLWTLQIELLFYCFVPFLIRKISPPSRGPFIIVLILFSLSLRA